MKTMLRIVLFVIVLLLAWPAAIFAHESPVDHVGREMRLWWADGRLHVGYRLLLTERAALLQLKLIDADGDGKISDDERAAYFSKFADDLAGKFQVTLGTQKVSLHPDGPVRLDPALGQSFEFVADSIDLPAGKIAGELLDYYSRAYPGPYRLIHTPTATGAAVDVSDSAGTTDSHPGMVIVRFDVTIPAK